MTPGPLLAAHVALAPETARRRLVALRIADPVAWRAIVREALLQASEAGVGKPEAAARLVDASVRAVAADLGVSERHLRRVFREAVGMGPKSFARLARFHRALRAARGSGPANWAGIAAEAGYYDQAHLIGEFRAIAGTTPRALLDELM